MRPNEAVTSLGALAHEHRLACYRLLVQAGPNGMAAGSIAQRLGVPPSSLTFHLQQMLHAGLATQRRVGRQIIYAADFARMDALVLYLTDNCCGRGSDGPPLCRPAVDAATPALAGKVSA